MQPKRGKNTGCEVGMRTDKCLYILKIITDCIFQFESKSAIEFELNWRGFISGIGPNLLSTGVRNGNSSIISLAIT